MKVAVTKSTLRIPPTYFAVNHAQKLSEQYDLSFFTLVADVDGADLHFPVSQSVPKGYLSFRQREMIIPLFLHAMYKAIHKFNADVIHQHFATWCLPAVTASRKGSTPLITTLHGADVMVALRPPRTMMERWHRWNFRLAMEHSAKVLAVSRYLADRALEAGADPARLEVHYQGIDTDYFVPTDRSVETVDEPVVLFVGSLNEQKGVRELVEASIQVFSRLPHQLKIIGGGPLAQELAEASRQYQHVHLLGQLPREDVRTQLQLARILVAPSKEHQGRREAAGLVLLEAQACGTPVVASRSGGMPEMLVEDETGFLTDEGDVTQIAAALERLLMMPKQEYGALRQRCREFVVTQRSLEISCVELEAHYRQVVAGT